jgi:[ribosomal protein S5]-alanine N-acetyltransferase
VIPLPIETDRLVIRPWSDDDLPYLETMFGDREVMRYISLRERTIPEVLAEYRTRYDELGLSFWALCAKEGAIVGEVGFAFNTVEGCPEVGWALGREAWGHGYATEGTRACIDACFAHTAHDRIVAMVDTRNERSLRTAGRLGMRAVHEVEHPAHPHMLFEVTRA